MRESVLHKVRVVVTVAALGIACGFETGPTLDVQVENATLRPTTGNSQLCCCHVVGTVVNRSTVPVHVTAEFEGFEAGNTAKPVARALDFLPDMQPSERRSFTAVGFVLPCGTINEFRLVQPLNVRGVFTPPR